MKKLLLIPLVLFLVGCATMADRDQFYQAQQVFFKNIINQEQPPLFAMEAVPGKAIENLASISVYMPQAPIDPKSFKQFSDAHPAWDVVGTTIKTAGQVLGIYFIADGVKSIFDTVTRNAGSTTMTLNGTGNTATIAGPTVNSLSGTGHVAGGIVDQTHTPTIVTQPPPVIVNPVVVNAPDPAVVVVP